MRFNITDSELREQLKAEQTRFKELDKQKQEMAQGDLTIQNLSEHITAWEQLKAAWQDSAEEIAHLYKKLHPYFPTGTCGNCGSVTTPILGSGRNHYGCVACGEETIA